VALRQTLLNNPPNPCTLFKCALHLHMSIVHSASSMLCLSDPNIDVARCGWSAHMMSNGEEMFRFAQHDKIPCVIASECNERGNQQAKNPRINKRFYAV
ncbi:MAG: hypothetical protein K2N70_01935, partial [Helicobacter sp.]|nr:hypothetical protein [Helicobacter sp.]